MPRRRSFEEPGSDPCRWHEVPDGPDLSSGRRIATQREAPGGGVGVTGGAVVLRRRDPSGQREGGARLDGGAEERSWGSEPSEGQGDCPARVGSQRKVRGTCGEARGWRWLAQRSHLPSAPSGPPVPRWLRAGREAWAAAEEAAQWVWRWRERPPIASIQQTSTSRPQRCRWLQARVTAAPHVRWSAHEADPFASRRLPTGVRRAPAARSRPTTQH